MSKRENVIVNRLNKTKREVKNPDLRTERESRDKLEREEKKKQYKKVEKQMEEDEKKKRAEAELRSYDRVMNEEQMKSNKDGGSDSDDFMWYVCIWWHQNKWKSLKIAFWFELDNYILGGFKI